MADTLTGMPNDGRLPDGAFWIDRCRALKHDPEARLNIALEFLPLPAAFGEAMDALADIIQRLKKSGTPVRGDLELFYSLRCVSRFLCSVLYVEGVGPGFNVAASMPREVWSNLPMNYEDIGYRELGFQAREVRWFVEEWGEPRTHKDPFEVYRGVWEEYAEKARAEEQRSRSAFRDYIRSLREGQDASRAPQGDATRSD